MVCYIDDHKDRFGVEPICQVLPIAPSTYYEMKARERDPGRPARYHSDQVLKPEITRVWHENFQVYGARNVWKQLKRESTLAARCTVARLMKDLGLRGARRGKAFKTTIPVWLSASSSRHGPINCGLLTSPLSQPGGVLYLSISSLTCSPGASLAGVSQPRSKPIWCSMHWNRLFTLAASLTT